MDIKRLWHSLRLYTIFNSQKRGDYLRKHKLFHHVGENVRIPTMLLPLYPELISIGDNVEIASGVKFVTHDAIHGVLNHKNRGEQFHENIGCIEIGSNCFIGADTIILANVRIGSNVVVGAGSMVNKDIPDDSVCAGTPVKVFGSFADLEKKRKEIRPYEGPQAHWEAFRKHRQ